MVAIVAATAAPLCMTAAAPSGAAAAPKSSGQARIVSVDGPARLTLRAKGGKLKVRLTLIDTPEPGECGAAESTAALERLTQRKGGLVRYVLWGRKPDAEGRMPALVGPARSDLTERSLARDLVVREWARSAPAVTISEADGISLSIGGDQWGPRPARGVWARCGGHFHLPAAAPVPAHAPAVWNVDDLGVTNAIGPIVLSPELSPTTVLTVAALRQFGAIELSPAGEGLCNARIPSLEISALATTSAEKPSCDTADVYGFSSSGPGVAATSNGLRAGGTPADADARFPRLRDSEDDLVGDELPLSGYTPVPWAWQTVAGMNERTDRIAGFYTSTSTPPR